MFGNLKRHSIISNHIPAMLSNQPRFLGQVQIYTPFWVVEWTKEIYDGKDIKSHYGGSLWKMYTPCQA